MPFIFIIFLKHYYRIFSKNNFHNANIFYALHTFS